MGAQDHSIFLFLNINLHTINLSFSCVFNFLPNQFFSQLIKMLKCLSLQHNKNFSINFTNTALHLSSSSKANFSSESILTDSISIICTQFSTHNSLASVLDTSPKYPGSSTSSSPGFPPTLWAVLASFGKFTTQLLHVEFP